MEKGGGLMGKNFSAEAKGLMGGQKGFGRCLENGGEGQGCEIFGEHA